MDVFPLYPLGHTAEQLKVGLPLLDEQTWSSRPITPRQEARNPAIQKAVRR